MTTLKSTNGHSKKELGVLTVWLKKNKEKKKELFPPCTHMTQDHSSCVLVEHGTNLSIFFKRKPNHAVHDSHRRESTPECSRKGFFLKAKYELITTLLTC